jgi:hypothetical protein
MDTQVNGLTGVITSQDLFSNGTAMAGAAVGVTTAGTIAGTTSAGAAPTVAIPSGFTATEKRGTFELTPVTGGGAQAAGIVATVRFTSSLAVKPNIIVQMNNVTDTTGAIVVSAINQAVTGFDICVGTALTTAKVYRISYVCVA